VEIDLVKKYKVLASYTPVCQIGNLKHLIKQNKDIIGWRESLRHRYVK